MGHDRLGRDRRGDRFPRRRAAEHCGGHRGARPGLGLVRGHDLPRHHRLDGDHALARVGTGPARRRLAVRRERRHLRTTRGPDLRFRLAAHLGHPGRRVPGPGRRPDRRARNRDREHRRPYHQPGDPRTGLGGARRNHGVAGARRLGRQGSSVTHSGSRSWRSPKRGPARSSHGRCTTGFSRPSPRSDAGPTIPTWSTWRGTRSSISVGTSPATSPHDRTTWCPGYVRRSGRSSAASRSAARWSPSRLRTCRGTWWPRVRGRHGGGRHQRGQTRPGHLGDGVRRSVGHRWRNVLDQGRRLGTGSVRDARGDRLVPVHPRKNGRIGRRGRDRVDARRRVRGEAVGSVRTAPRSETNR